MSRNTIIDEILRNHMLVKAIGEQNQLFHQNNPGMNLRSDSRGMAYFSQPFFLRDYLRLDTVHWCPSHITLCQSSRDVMSFRFSGCFMARYRLRDKVYVAHVHCDEKRENDCRRDFAMFLKENASDITRIQVFQPGAGIWSHYANDIPDGMIRCLWGVFTWDWRAYSLLVDWNADTENSKFYLREVVEHCSYGRYMSYYGDLLKFADYKEEEFTDSVFDCLRGRLTDFWDSGSYEQVYRYPVRSFETTDDRKGYRCPCLLV